MSEETEEQRIQREVKKAMHRRPNLGGYDVKPDDDMTGHGWKKSLTVKYLERKENGEIWVEERDFYTKDFKCDCGANDYLWLIPQREGVGLGCCYCKTVDSTINKEYGILRKSYQITADEAYEILRAKGYKDKDAPMRPYLKALKYKKAKLYEARKRPK